MCLDFLFSPRAFGLATFSFCVMSPVMIMSWEACLELQPHIPFNFKHFTLKNLCHFNLVFKLHPPTLIFASSTAVILDSSKVHCALPFPPAHLSNCILFSGNHVPAVFTYKQYTHTPRGQGLPGVIAFRTTFPKVHRSGTLLQLCSQDILPPPTPGHSGRRKTSSQTCPVLGYQRAASALCCSTQFPLSHHDGLLGTNTLLPRAFRQLEGGCPTCRIPRLQSGWG